MNVSVYHEIEPLELPLVNNVPLFATIWSVYIALLYYMPKLVKNSPAFELKPFMLISDGFSFGSYGIGTLLGVYLINFGGKTFKSCHLTTHPLVDESLYLLGYAFLLVRHYEMLYPLFMVVRKKDNRKALLVALHNCGNCIVLIIEIRRYVADIAIFCILVQGLKLCLRSAYYALTVPCTFAGVRSLKRTICKVILVSEVVSLGQIFASAIRGCEFNYAVIFLSAFLSLAEIGVTLRSLLKEKSVIKRTIKTFTPLS